MQNLEPFSNLLIDAEQMPIDLDWRSPTLPIMSLMIAAE